MTESRVDELERGTFCSGSYEGTVEWFAEDKGNAVMFEDAEKIIAELEAKLGGKDVELGLLDARIAELEAELVVERAARELAEAKLDKLAINFGDDYKL